jgi:hypothetical protein
VEREVIMNLTAVSGGTLLFRLWRHNFTTAFEQVGGACEEIVHRLVKEIDLGNELEKVVTGLKEEFGDEFNKVSADVWNFLTDKAEAEAYDKIKMAPKGQGVVVHGVLHRWFTDVSGLSLAEQARMLTHPARPKREEELAEHVEMWQDNMRRLEADGQSLSWRPSSDQRAENAHGRQGQRVF